MCFLAAEHGGDQFPNEPRCVSTALLSEQHPTYRHPFCPGTLFPASSPITAPVLPRRGLSSWYLLMDYRRTFLSSVKELELGGQGVQTSQSLHYLPFFSPKAPTEAQNSLIDLGPSTPSAAKQPEVTNNLSSQLAGMSELPCSTPLGPYPENPLIPLNHLLK